MISAQAHDRQVQIDEGQAFWQLQRHAIPRLHAERLQVSHRLLHGRFKLPIGQRFCAIGQQVFDGQFIWICAAVPLESWLRRASVDSFVIVALFFPRFQELGK